MCNSAPFIEAVNLVVLTCHSLHPTSMDPVFKGLFAQCVVRLQGAGRKAPSAAPSGTDGWPTAPRQDIMLKNSQKILELAVLDIATIKDVLSGKKPRAVLKDTSHLRPAYQQYLVMRRNRVAKRP